MTNSEVRKLVKMELTEKEGIVIRNFLNHYHLKYKNSKDRLSLKNQLELLYDYTFTLIK